MGDKYSHRGTQGHYISLVVRFVFEVEIQNAHNMIVIVRSKIFKNTTLLSLIK